MNKVWLIVVLLVNLACIKCYYLPLSLSQCSSNGVCTPSSTGLVLDGTPASSTSQSYFNNAGLTSDGTTLTMTGQRRLYLVNAGQNSYQLFNLKGKEFSFDVDTSGIGCGGNGALYFTAMSNSGSNYANGAGYCDAPTGCNEMDLWEANNQATAMTSHSCSSGCDTSGCQYNPYRNGQTSFYGIGKTVDSSKKFTVVTQFLTDSSGNLNEIKQFYVQGGKTIPGYSLTPTYCNQWWQSIGVSNNQGGLTTIGNVANWVLVCSFWSGSMGWLDSPPNGPCSNDNFSGGKVTFGNLKFGPIGSTTGSTSSVSSTVAASSSTSARATTTTTTGSASSGWAVYTDSLQNSFQDWSWASPRSFSATAKFYKGQFSISFELNSYGAIYFHSSSAFQLSLYTKFTFYFNSPVSGSVLVVLLYDSNGNKIGTDQTVPSVTANTWTPISITLQNFNVASSTLIGGIAIQATTSYDAGLGYCDEVYFK